MGNREMMCLSLAADIDVDSIAKAIALVVSQARVAKESYINILFLAQSVSEVFKYKDEFTKYVDIGVRVYIEKSAESLKDIILKECKILYTLTSDVEVRKVIRDIPTSIIIREV